MANQSSEERFGVEEWAAQVLRVTLFPASWERPDDLGWWAQMTGEEPESETLKRRQGILQESGPLEDGQLALSIQPTRIDLLFASKTTDYTEKEGEDGTPPTLGQFQQALAAFLKAVKNWFALESCPAAERLAFGAVLLRPVENRSQGYTLLNAFLPYVQLDPDGSSNLLYRINRRRPLKMDIPALQVNRLSAWSVMKWQTGQAAIQGLEITKHVPIEEGCACRLELDINTVPTLLACWLASNSGLLHKSWRLWPRRLPAAETFHDAKESHRTSEHPGDPGSSSSNVWSGLFDGWYAASRGV